MGFVNTRVVNNKSVHSEARGPTVTLHYLLSANIIIYDKYLHIIAIIHIK